tara:strand:+ start:1612 stop:2223 length:612 start_codon:yes stop_codon:yes gene_type:complete
MKDIVRTTDPVLGYAVDQETEGDMIVAEATLLDNEAAFSSGDMPEEHWLPEFYMKKHEDLKQLEARIKEQSKRMLNAIKARRAGLSWKFGRLFENIVQRMILDQGGKKKSVDLFNGRAGYRSKKASIKVVDEAAFLDWFDRQPADIQAEVEPCLDRKVARKTPITEYIAACGDIPDGIEHIESHESFYPDISFPELPELQEEA